MPPSPLHVATVADASASPSGHFERGGGSNSVGGSSATSGGASPDRGSLMSAFAEFRPSELSPPDRTRAIAAIFAAGLCRLRWPLVSSAPPGNSPPEKSQESLVNPLELSAHTSVTVHTS